MGRGERTLVRAMALGALASAILLLAPAAQAAQPAPTVTTPTPTVSYYGSLFVQGMKLADDTLVVQDPDGRDVCVVGPDPEPGEKQFTCFITDQYTSPRQTGSRRTYTVFQRDGADLSPVVDVAVTFAPRRLGVTSARNLPAGADVSLAGTREEGGAFTIRWSLKRGSKPVFDGFRDCSNGDTPDEQSEGDRFHCDLDEGTVPRTTAVARAGRAALPDGTYSAVVDEFTSGVTERIDRVAFDFTVGDPPDDDGGGEQAAPGSDPGTDSGSGTGQAPASGGAGTEPPTTQDSAGDPDTAAPEASTTAPPEPTAPSDEPRSVAAPVTGAPDRDVLRILTLAVIAFTVMAMNGSRGVGWPRRLAAAPRGESAYATGGLHREGTAARTGAASLGALAGAGSTVDGTDDSNDGRPFGDAWGDRSVTWRTPGWRWLDSFSFAAPVWLSSRLPLVARVGADASYVRAVLGVLWLALPVLGAVLGVVAAVQGSPAPVPPSVGLTAAILVLGVVDAAAGVTAVTAFAAMTLARGGLTAGSLDLGDGVRGLLGLAALWFVAPLVAAAARPFRRTAEPGHVYGWDRVGDTVIAALVSAWAVQGIAGSLGDLTGRDVSVTDRADTLALVTIAAVVGRFALEELTALLYPRRLRAVQEHGDLPEPSTLQQVRGLVVRSALLVFFAGAFLGSCWQLWVGVAIFAVPQLLALAGDRVPDVRGLARVLPRGVLQVLVLAVVGAVIAYAVDRHGDRDALAAVRDGFVLLALPGALLEVLTVGGGDPPEPRWTWPRQLAGAVVVAVTVVLVLVWL